jgi:hypothetical protein
MKITQEQADAIVQSIKDDLAEQFGDIENIDLPKAMKIALYCNEKVSLYNANDTPVKYAYWFHMKRSYTQAVLATLASENMDD